MNQAETNLWSTPNMLTGMRIAAVPVVVLLLLFPGRWASSLAAIFFVLAGATDFLDGFLARRYRIVSRFGYPQCPLETGLRPGEVAQPPPHAAHHELIASGWHTAAVTMRLLVDHIVPEEAILPSPGCDELRRRRDGLAPPFPPMFRGEGSLAQRARHSSDR